MSDVKNTCAVVRDDTNDLYFAYTKISMNYIQDTLTSRPASSLQENLMFTGIPMQDKFEESEMKEKFLEKYMTEQLKLYRIAEFYCAHRFSEEYVELPRLISEIHDKANNLQIPK